MAFGCDKTVAIPLFCVFGLLIPVANSPAAGQALSMTGTDCARLVEHVPSADVDYKPGVDVLGRPVAPADLPGGPKIELPETITFDVAVDLRRFGLPKSSRLYEPHAELGRVTVDRNGRVYFNGVPLQSADRNALAEFCRERTKNRR